MPTVSVSTRYKEIEVAYDIKSYSCNAGHIAMIRTWYGYRVEWYLRRSRLFGINRCPTSTWSYFKVTSALTMFESICKQVSTEWEAK
jgi:hypothetical protein